MTEIDLISIKRLQQFCLRRKQVEVSKGQAGVALANFWRQVRVAPGGCWLWNGIPTIPISYTKGGSRTDSLGIDAQHFACVIEEDAASCDHYSKFLPTCQTPLCIRPAHKVELVLLTDAYWLLVDRGLGEDDLQELAWRFRERVEHGDFERYIWKGQPAARQADFERWLQSEGEQLEAAFRLKYAQDTGPGQLPFHAHSGVGWKRVSFDWRRKSRPDWWERVAVPSTEIPLLIARYRELVRVKAEEARRYRLMTGERGGEERIVPELDDATLLRQIERLCTRLIVHENDCWTWDKPDAQFRLYRGGPLVSPHEVLWTIFSGIHVYSVWNTRVASHTGLSWCINPTHSDILANTTGAAFMVFDGEDPPIVWPEGAVLSHEERDRLRHLIYRAIEQGELPWMLDEHHDINVWRAEVLAWARSHRADLEGIAPLLFTSRESTHAEERSGAQSGR